MRFYTHILVAGLVTTGGAFASTFEVLDGVLSYSESGWSYGGGPGGGSWEDEETVNVLDYVGGYTIEGEYGVSGFDGLQADLTMQGYYYDEAYTYDDGMMNYGYGVIESSDIWMSITTDIGLYVEGTGEMGYTFSNSVTGTSFSGMSGDLNGFLLGAGQWEIALHDDGFGEETSWSYNDYDEMTGDYSSESYYHYSVEGTVTVGMAVPAPGALALLGFAGLASRRRR